MEFKTYKPHILYHVIIEKKFFQSQRALDRQTHPQKQQHFSTEFTWPFLLSSLMSPVASLTQLCCTQAPMERVHHGINVFPARFSTCSLLFSILFDLC